VAEPSSSFDPVELAAATAGHLPDYCGKHWLSGATLERWLLTEGLARTGRVTVGSSAKQGKRRLRVAVARYSGGEATCSFAGVRRGLAGVRVGTSGSRRSARSGP
jgi:hypothetical protein